jgi:hypothetical protein
MPWILPCFGFEWRGRPLCTRAPDHDPRDAVRTPGAATVHGLQLQVAPRLTDRDAGVSIGSEDKLWIN